MFLFSGKMCVCVVCKEKKVESISGTMSLPHICLIKVQLNFKLRMFFDIYVLNYNEFAIYEEFKLFDYTFEEELRVQDGQVAVAYFEGVVEFALFESLQDIHLLYCHQGYGSSLANTCKFQRHQELTTKMIQIIVYNVCPLTSFLF